MFSSLRSCTTAALLAFSVCAHAQYVVRKFVFKNPGAYTDEQLIAASGLHIGQTFTSADLQKSAQSMIDTGVFEELSPTLEGPYKSITLTYTLTSIAKSKTVPISLENFVWFTPQEADAELRKRVPLYAGSIPEAGNLQEQVKTALVAMLKDKGITAEVTAMEISPSPSHPFSAMQYTIASPQIFLTSAGLAGVSEEMKAKVNGFLRTIVGKPYEEGHGTDADDVLLSIYRDQGYADAKVLNLRHTPTAAATPGRYDVRLSGTVVPGELFRVQSVTWAGSPTYSAADFEHESKLHPGDVAEGSKLKESTAVITAAYLKQGYMFAEVDPHADLDRTAHTVAYTYAVRPGDQYRMGQFKVLGLSPSQTATLKDAWAIKTGDLYDDGYLKEFLRKNTGNIAKGGFQGSYKIKSDPATHTVDVTAVFAAKNSPRNSTEE